MDTSDAITRLAVKLQVLKDRDAAREVFGASSHNYDCTPVSERTLTALEGRIGASLPADYRIWLLQVGHGAGPYYGLLSPQQIATEIRYDERGVGGDVEDAASITTAHVRRYLEAVRAAGTPAGVRIASDSFAGAVPINHQGCGGYSHILVAGELRGAVFGECGDIIGEPWTAAAAFWPEAIGQDPALDQQPLSFLRWMDNWLDTSLATLG